MKLYSTENPNFIVDLKTAVLTSLAPDKGLYMPQDIPKLPSTFFDIIYDMSFAELSFEVAKHLLAGDITDRDLYRIVSQAINFEAPVKMLSDRLGVLELWHGPSLAFKDFGARFMAGLMSHYNDSDQLLTILVATSGDTGGAVAYGFYDVPGIEVVILYPSGKVSHWQEKQLTTLGNNIRAVEIQGSFDDCQHFVKQAFLDPELNEIYRLSSANSINIARLIPQSFYYFEAYRQLVKRGSREEVVFAVPSGNFGNLTAGLFAKEMGLPISHFIAATNTNHIVPTYLETGQYRPAPSVATISNAMDVGNPSNFARLKALFGNEHGRFTQAMSGYWYDDDTTRLEIQRIKELYNYVSEPHGAIAHKALDHYLHQHPEAKGVFLATAHPAKFIDVVEAQIGTIDIPHRLAELAVKEKQATLIPNDYHYFKAYLKANK